MKRTVLVVLLVAFAAAQESSQPRAVGCLGETGGALLGGALVGAGAAVVLGAVGAAVASSAYPFTSSESAVFGWALISGAAGAAFGYPLGCGLGTTLIGKSVHAEGNTGAAYGGAYAGLALGALAGLVSRRWDVGLLAAGVLPPAGAVIGYNMGTPSSLGARFALPTLAYRSRLGPERQRCSDFDCRLVAVRF